MPIGVVIGLFVGLPIYLLIGLVVGTIYFNRWRPIDNLTDLVFGIFFAFVAAVLWPGYLVYVGMVLGLEQLGNNLFKTQ